MGKAINHADEAQRCRRLAQCVPDDPASARLLDLAAEHEALAAEGAFSAAEEQRSFSAESLHRTK